MYLCAGSDSAGLAGIGGDGGGGGGGGGCAALARFSTDGGFYHDKSSYSTACGELAVAPNLIRCQRQTNGGTRTEDHFLAACMASVSDR